MTQPPGWWGGIPVPRPRGFWGIAAMTPETASTTTSGASTRACRARAACPRLFFLRFPPSHLFTFYPRHLPEASSGAVRWGGTTGRGTERATFRTHPPPRAESPGPDVFCRSYLFRRILVSCGSRLLLLLMLLLSFSTFFSFFPDSILWFVDAFLSTVAFVRVRGRAQTLGSLLYGS